MPMGPDRTLFTGRTSDAGALSARRADLTLRTCRPGRTLCAGRPGDAGAWGARCSDWTYRAAGRKGHQGRPDRRSWHAAHQNWSSD